MSSRLSLRPLVLVLCVAIAAAASPRAARAESGAESFGPDEPGLYRCGKPRGKVRVRFKPEVDARELISWAMGFSCKSFVYERSIVKRSARIDVIVPEELSAREAWQLFLVGLQSMGLTVVPKGRVLEVVEASTAKSHPLRLHQEWPGNLDSVARMILRPAHLPASDAAGALEALKSKIGVVTALPGPNLLVVTDYASNIGSMRTLLDEIDVPAPEQTLYSIALTNVDAAGLVPKLQELLGVDSSPAPRPRDRGKPGAESAVQPAANTAVPVKLLADERTNAIFMLGSEAAYRRVKALVARLDLDLGGRNDARVHIHKLDNTEATKVAGTLTTLLGQSAGAAAPARRGAPAPGPAPSAGAPTVEGEVRIAADETSNSLLILASMRDYLALRPILVTLDERRKQVYIEAVIMEVNTSEASKLGVAYHGGRLDDGRLSFGGFQSGGLSTVTPVVGLDGVFAGILGKSIEMAIGDLGISIPSFGAVFNAAASDGVVDVLSSPHLLTADHQTAKLAVGDNIPYRSGQVATPDVPNPLLQTYAPISREDVTLQLEITPHISESGLVSMDVALQIKSLGQADFGAGLGPTWRTKEIKNTVMVHDQETVVLGGLMEERVTRDVSKVPVLGDIPVLGHLFRSETEEESKTSLLVVLTPHIVGDRLDGHDILQRRMRERREFLAAVGSLPRKEYRPAVDYRRKVGLLEAINQEVERHERDAAALRAMEAELRPIPEGRIEVAPAGAAPDAADGSLDTP